MIPERVSKLLNTCSGESPCIPPTLLYNEGWMLRLVLDWFASIDLQTETHPLAVPPDCSWYSEALLPSPFLATSRGDSRAESWTHADAAIGHFEIGKGAKGNLTLLPNAKHLVVLEAKMFSKLSAGVKNAPHFNQAARNVACIAEVLKRAGRPASEFSALGFYVLAPRSQIQDGIFDEQLAKDSIRNVVEKRVAGYEGERDKWFSEWFIPTHAKLKVNAIGWEDLIAFLVGRDRNAEELNAFYGQCLECNQSAKTIGCTRKS